LRRDAGLRKAIGALLFCSVAGITTSFVREPLVVWPLAISMLGAMIFLVATMQIETKRKRELKSPLSE
jgi:peptidoglycan/LPS O-acetylase OafA/YrhL